MAYTAQCNLALGCLSDLIFYIFLGNLILPPLLLNLLIPLPGIFLLLISASLLFHFFKTLLTCHQIGEPFFDHPT